MPEKYQKFLLSAKPCFCLFLIQKTLVQRLFFLQHFKDALLKPLTAFICAVSSGTCKGKRREPSPPEVGSGLPCLGGGSGKASPSRISFHYQLLHQQPARPGPATVESWRHLVAAAHLPQSLLSALGHPGTQDTTAPAHTRCLNRHTRFSRRLCILSLWG